MFKIGWTLSKNIKMRSNLLERHEEYEYYKGTKELNNLTPHSSVKSFFNKNEKQTKGSADPN